MKDLTDLKFFIGGIIRPLIREAVVEALSEALQDRQINTNTPDDSAPILSAAEVKKMTGWPAGTFYAKVAQMPNGVVIRGKSKRLLFDRVKFLQWLQNPA